MAQGSEEGAWKTSEPVVQGVPPKYGLRGEI